MNDLVARYPSIPWIAPFAVFMAMLALTPAVGIPQPWESIVRIGVPALVLAVVSRGILGELRIRHGVASTLLGLAVCALWVGPDLLIPGWRSHWLFQNALTGKLEPSLPADVLADPLVLALRIARAAIVVPIVEELFWRGWLPRWLVNNDWQKVPLGTYTTMAFVATAALFAVEHGPFWEVGLLCGLIYNWWMWRTKSLGDLVLTHAVTNAALAAVVLATGRYEFW